MEAWIRRAKDLLSRLEVHSQKLEDLRRKARPYLEETRERDRASHPRAEELARLQKEKENLSIQLSKFRAGAARSRRARQRAEQIQEIELPEHGRKIRSLLDEIDRDRSWELGDAEEQWQHDVLSGLVRGLEALREPRRGGLADMRRRLGLARTLRRRSLEEPAARAAWEEAIARIKAGDGVTASKLYRHLELTPQVGLVPIGMDPDSKLWEFAQLLSGERAKRDPHSGKLLLNERTGIVLVLLPPGHFWMGAQNMDPSEPNYDPEAEPDEADERGNAVEVELDMFFLSKHEMTQGQWERIANANPSTQRPDERRFATRDGTKAVTLLHPVENVDWSACKEMLRRLDLELPTEAQWEYAARAGTDSFWWTGSDKPELEEAANLADGFCQVNGGHLSWRYDEELNDGFVVHAPVGSLGPNGFGLHDVLGNVWEWCRDRYGTLDTPRRPGDGLRHNPGARLRVFRGGSWYNPSVHARSANRARSRPEGRFMYSGVRPARAVRGSSR
ncbi:MAG: formylglycine-generating enzyme family protein, partial [Planctomycetota bacterium]